MSRSPRPAPLRRALPKPWPKPLPVPALCACLLGAALVAGNALAQSEPAHAASAMPPSAASSGTTGQAAGRADRHFLETAAQGGAAEVALGKIAQERASSSAVKAFAERMVQDHSKANDDLMRIGRTRGLPASAQPSNAQQKDADRLTRLTGADFDRAYMKHMVDDHEKTVAAFQKASRSAQDPEVRDFAAKTLPTLESHLQLARSTYDGVRQGRGAGSAPSMPSAASASSR